MSSHINPYILPGGGGGGIRYIPGWEGAARPFIP